jgi:N-acetyl-gamma-glutamyl-phosphate reductase
MAKNIRVAVAGGTGYSGVELVRLLLLHPDVEVARVTSEQYAGRKLHEVFPSFRGQKELLLESLDASRLAQGVDLVFSALPHGTAAATVVKVLEKGTRVVDLSADFRLRRLETFQHWYGDHPAPELLAEAVYGIPEFYRDRIRGARIVAVPGCYPTGALFGLIPLARGGLIAEGSVVIDAKSGVSGAGRSAKTDLLFGEVEENVRAYGVGAHRHGPEIEQELWLAGGPDRVIFTPHLLPIRRGILSTIYVPLRERCDLEAVYREAYDREPFIQLLGGNCFPEVRNVRGTNNVQIGWTVVDAHSTAIVVTAIDNLGKGAAGQAVQNMNVMFGLEEDTGLRAVAAVP